MNDFNKIIWGFVISAIGIVLGWILNQLGQWFRTRQEDKKNLKVVLFNLLEVYFIFVRSDTNKLVQKISNKVYLHIPKDQQTEENEELIQELYTELLTNHLKPIILKELETVQENYQSSIKTLATIDPLTAYYLSGKTNIFNIFDSIQNWFDDLKEQFPDEQNEIEESGQQVLKIFKPDFFQETLDDLENDIRKISWKINPYVWYKGIKAINRLRLNTNELLEKEIDNMFEKLKPLMGG